jgi:hypothetical protein
VGRHQTAEDISKEKIVFGKNKRKTNLLLDHINKGTLEADATIATANKRLKTEIYFRAMFSMRLDEEAQKPPKPFFKSAARRRGEHETTGFCCGLNFNEAKIVYVQKRTDLRISNMNRAEIDFIQGISWSKADQVARKVLECYHRICLRPNRGVEKRSLSAHEKRHQWDQESNTNLDKRTLFLIGISLSSVTHNLSCKSDGNRVRTFHGRLREIYVPGYEPFAENPNQSCFRQER